MAKSNKDFFKKYKKTLKGKIKLGGKYQTRNVEIRSDPLFGLHSTLICCERAQRGGVFKQTEPIKMKPKEECIFCKEGGLYTKTPDERNFHFATEPNPGYELISFPNLFPFSIPHTVTVISDSIDELEGITGMFDFINWGPDAGASIDHPHAQRGGLVDLMRTSIDKEIDKCEEIKRATREDYFGDYLDIVRATKDEKDSLYCFENDTVLVSCPFAPRFSDQVDIVYKKQVNNILDLRVNERDDIGDAMVKVLHALGSLDKLPEDKMRRNVTNLNVALHQARFGDKRDYYRIHWHVTPRMTKIGSLEALYGAYVVDVFPETTAENIRELVKGG